MLAANRDEINFPHLAKQAFSFLSNPPFSMALVSLGPLAISFEANGVSVKIFHDRLSYELGLALWRPTEADEVDRPYSISDLMRVTNPSAANKYRRFAATRADALRRGLEKLGDELRLFGSAALSNDPKFFRQLLIAREAAVREFGRDMETRAARAAGQQAWSEREWYNVAQAYGRIEDFLSVTERKRLAVARRKLVEDA